MWSVAAVEKLESCGVVEESVGVKVAGVNDGLAKEYHVLHFQISVVYGLFQVLEIVVLVLVEVFVDNFVLPGVLVDLVVVLEKHWHQ